MVHQNQSLLIKIVVGASVAGILLLIFFTWLYLGLKKQKHMMLREIFFKKNGGIMLQQRISDGGTHDQAKVFTIDELKKATTNYDESRIIGKGGYDTVYKGILSDNRVVVIKKSKLANQTQSQIKQFINEIVILCQISHKNVVTLIGCCLETEVPSLGYVFISNGTLSDHIHVEGNSLALTWDIRLRVGTSAACVSVIHRDVYSFGVVVVELLTGKKALSFDRPEEERNLAMYFLSSLKQGRLFHVLDEHLQLNAVHIEIIQVSKLAERCLHVKGDERPTMKEVANGPEGILASTVQKHP